MPIINLERSRQGTYCWLRDLLESETRKFLYICILIPQGKDEGFYSSDILNVSQSISSACPDRLVLIL